MSAVSVGGATLNSYGSRDRFWRQKRRSRKGAVEVRSTSRALSGWRAILVKGQVSLRRVIVACASVVRRECRIVGSSSMFATGRK